MKYIPLPDNKPETINKFGDEIYRKLNTVDKTLKGLTGEFSLDQFVNSTDADKINLIARYLKLL